MLTHDAVVDYNSATKVNPPLREQKDIEGLIKGIEEGVIDTITSQHSPQDEECKKLEFDKADFGMIGFETLFPICNTVLNKTVGLEKIIDLLAVNPRKLLNFLHPHLKQEVLPILCCLIRLKNGRSPKKTLLQNQKTLLLLEKPSPEKFTKPLINKL